MNDASRNFGVPAIRFNGVDYYGDEAMAKLFELKRAYDEKKEAERKREDQQRDTSK